MSLPNYLAKIKSSGLYRFVWDKSEIAGVDAEVLRLVVGYSEKGPFNTPVYIKTVTEFKSIFGDISKKLEKRGVYFHRNAIQALKAGPIICLNLKKFTNETVDAANFNVEQDIVTQSVGITEIYDTTRFWKLDPNTLQHYFETKLPVGAEPRYISLASTDSKESSCTIVMRGYTPTGYDVTLKSWFSQVGEEYPSYAEGFENLLVSDFFAEIYVFRGEFTPSLATSEALKRYFDVNGTEIKLKPYVTNAFEEKVDTLAALAADENSGFVNSYNGILLPYFKNAAGTYISLDLLFNSDNPIHKMMIDFNTEALDSIDGYLSKLVTTGWTAKENHPILSSDALVLTEVRGQWDRGQGDHGEWVFAKTTRDDDPKAPTCFEPDFYKYAIEGDEHLAALDAYKWGAANFTVGDRFVVKTAEDAQKEWEDADKEVVTLSKIEVHEDESGESSSSSTSSTISLVLIDNNGTEVNDEQIQDYLVKVNHSAGETCDNLVLTYFKGYQYENSKPTEPTIEIDPETGESKIVQKASMTMDARRRWINSILSTLIEYPGIRLALTNRTDIDYRYIVDTFEALVDKEGHKELSLIAKEKENALALINFPAAKTFMDCKYTHFTDSNGRFQVQYIKDGFNKQKPASIIFALISEENGASFVSYNSPVVISDGTVNTTCPSAALVSNNFMEKYASRQPYYIVAGPNYGRIIETGLVGPDFNYSRADLDILEPMGVNIMVFVPRKGTFINSNQTAKQNPVTALSKINVRELVIYIQDEIEKLLQNYHWEINTQELRDKIKEKADYICENVKANGGIYDYLNVCDESNNTDDVINNEMLVLSTSIEPGIGAGKMVQELILYKKGGMKAILS